MTVAKFSDQWWDLPLKDRPCSRCGKGQRVVRASGKIESQCAECIREKQRDYYRNRQTPEQPSGGPGRNAQRICQRCKQRPKMIFSSGNMANYCKECRSVKRRESYVSSHPDAAYQPSKGNSAPRHLPAVREAPVAPAPIPTEPAVERVTIQDPNASQEVFGLMTEMMLLIDRSRGSVQRGAISRMQVAIETQGVRLALTTEGVQNHD